MHSQSHDDLSLAKQSYEQGNYQDALQQIDTIASTPELSDADRIACSLLESNVRIKLGETEAALMLTQEVLEEALKLNDLLTVVDALSNKAEIFWISAKLDEGLRAVEEGQETIGRIKHDIERIDEKEINQREAELLHHGGIIHWYMGNLNQSLDFHQRSLAIKEKLEDRNGIANSFNNLGLVYWSKGHLEEAIAYYQNCLTIHEELGNTLTIARTLNNLGNVYSVKGDLDQALDYYEGSLSIKKELGQKHEIPSTLTNLGVGYQLKGDLDRALHYFQQGLDLSEDLGTKPDMALALGNLGGIYELTGELDTALEHNQRSLAIYQELGLKPDIARMLANIGAIYEGKGNHQEALALYNQSMELCKQLELNTMTSVILFSLVTLALHAGNKDQARHHLDELEDLNAQTEIRVVDQRYRVAKALSLKTSKRARHMVRAAEILEGVVNEEVADHALTVTAMIHLCDLQVLELKVTGDEQVFKNVKELTHRLLEITKKQSSSPLLVETTLLQSKFALVELDVKKSIELMAKAQNIAEQKGLELLASKVAYEQEMLHSQMQKWQQIVIQKPSRQEMIDMTQLDDLVERMIHKTVAVLTDKEKVISREVSPQAKYELVFTDHLSEYQKTERTSFRVGISQIGLSKTGDILQEFYEERGDRLFGLREEKVLDVQAKIQNMLESASQKGVDLLLFPELTIDLNYPQLLDAILALAQQHQIHIIPGSYHTPDSNHNISPVISPQGMLWEQEKHIPAMIHFEGVRLTEGIDTRSKPRKVTIGATQYGRIAITICRDFLDMDLRVELKNADPPVDIILNPAFTPVTADFKAAHFDARRSIYAYCFFANVAEFGDSSIYTPEKERVERNLPAGEEGLLYKDVDLFQLRSERKKWEIKQRKLKSFIQSTRR